jgi:hypothetical protein
MNPAGQPSPSGAIRLETDRFVDEYPDAVEILG